MCGKLHIEVCRVLDNAELLNNENNHENSEYNLLDQNDGFLGRTITCRVIVKNFLLLLLFYLYIGAN